MNLQKFKTWFNGELGINDENPLPYEIGGEDKVEVLTRNLSTYLDGKEFELLQFNLLAHYTICSKNKNPELYEMFNVASAEGGLVQSASSGSSSSTAFIPKSFSDNGNTLMLELFKTPYGKFAFSILESLNIVAVVI